MVKLSVSLLLFFASLLVIEAGPTVLSHTRAVKDPLSQTATDHYTLGDQVQDAVPFYFEKKTVDATARKINVQVVYPSTPAGEAIANDNDDNNVITKVEIYLTGSSGMESQVYVVDGGIGQRVISLDIEASQTDQLNYVVVLYGINA